MNEQHNAAEGLGITLRIRVEWNHCDPARIIFNPNYYIWMDHGTHALFKVAGFDLVEQLRDPAVRGFPLVRSEAEFISPAYFGDLLILHSRVKRFGNKSFEMTHRFERDGQTLCNGAEIRVWGASDAATPDVLKAIPVPDWIREAMAVNRTVDINV